MTKTLGKITAMETEKVDQEIRKNEKYFLSVSDAAGYEESGIATIKRKIKCGEIKVKKVKGKGRRKGLFENRIHYSQLSREAQDAFLSELNTTPAMEKKAPDNAEKRIFLDLTEKQKRRFSNREAIQKDVAQALQDVPYGSKGIVIKNVADQFGVSPDTVRRCIIKFKQEGRDALIPNWNGGQRQKTITNEIAARIKELYLVESGPSIREIWEVLNKEEIAIPYTTLVRHINKTWTPAQRMLFRDREEWNRKYSPYIRRDWDRIAINEIWIGDQKQLDVPCVFRGRIIFAWVTVFMDMKSRAYVGWILTAIPDAWAVAQAFVYAVRKYGPPKVVYLDRGKQYKAKANAGGKIKTDKVIRLFEDIKSTIIPGIFAELGTEIFWAAPYNAREKGVEPSLRLFNKLRHIFPGYRGPYVTKRPKDHEKLLKSAKLPSLKEMSQAVDKIITEYNQRIHSETKRTPNSFFVGFEPKNKPSEKLLAFLELIENHVTVRDSTVTVDGLVYRHDELWRLAGELVEVRRDPQNIQRAAIIYKNRIFCFATLEVPDHYRGPKTLEAVKSTRRIRRKISKWRKSVLEHETAIEDPLRYAAELEDQEIMRGRDIRPAQSKVTSLHDRERLARETMNGINQADEEAEEVEKKAAVGRKLTLEDLIPPPKPEPKRSKLDLFHKGLTIFNEPNGDDFYED